MAANLNDGARLEELLPWATSSQAEAINATLVHSTQRKAAAALGISPNAFEKRIAGARRRAARAGYSPDHDMTHPVAPGFHTKGVSTLYGADGQVKAQWVKANANAEDKTEQLLEAVMSIAEPFRGKSTPVKAPRGLDRDILTLYPMGDPHLGLYAWEQETGNSFDIEIAETNLVAAVDKLVMLAPPSERALVVNLGDFFHSDTSDNRTSRSGNALDVDTRWAKVLSVGIRTMRRVIDRAKMKHKIVRVFNQVGNHDDHTAIVLSLCLAQFYENDPRVEIDTSPCAFHYERFGKVLIGITHGDGLKAADLPGIMATDRAADWGATMHRYWYTGHVHHDTLKEFRGCTVETFRTLAARDAWHHRAGYRAGRDMKLDVLHREHGKTMRHIVGIDQLMT